MQTSESIATWLTLGPIYNPAHQADRHAPDDGHPTAAEIIQAIERESHNPVRLTASLATGPSAGDTLSYGDGSLFPPRDCQWQRLGFCDLDGSDPRAVQDGIHTRLGAGRLSQDPADPVSFAGKHHALIFSSAMASSYTPGQPPHTSPAKTPHWQQPVTNSNKHEETTKKIARGHAWCSPC